MSRQRFFADQPASRLSIIVSIAIMIDVMVHPVLLPAVNTSNILH